jgi:hypothetical protein
VYSFGRRPGSGDGVASGVLIFADSACFANSSGDADAFANPYGDLFPLFVLDAAAIAVLVSDAVAFPKSMLNGINKIAEIRSNNRQILWDFRSIIIDLVIIVSL